MNKSHILCKTFIPYSLKKTIARHIEAHVSKVKHKMYNFARCEIKVGEGVWIYFNDHNWLKAYQGLLHTLQRKKFRSFHIEFDDVYVVNSRLLNPFVNTYHSNGLSATRKVFRRSQ